MRLLFALFMSLTLLTLDARSEDDYRVYPLQNRQPEEIIPIFQSVFGARARFSHLQNKLVVSADPKHFPKIEQLLADLDRKAKMLLIEFRRAHATEVKAKQIGGNASVKIGKGGHVQIGQKPGSSSSGASAEVHGQHGSVGVHADQKNGAEAGHSIGQIRVMDGAWGSILASQGSGLDGMKAKARLQGKSYTLDLNQEGAQASSGQVLKTNITGNLGQWVSVGSVNQSSSNTSNGIGTGSKSQSQGNQELFVRISEAN